MSKKLISIVVPIFNEEENIFALYQALQSVFKEIALSYNYELILVDDGSKDKSWQLMKELAAFNSCIKILSFSRNFGHQMALTAGYDAARGDAIITIDADLQDPPSVILAMIKEWQKGFYIVYARRITRKDSLLKKFVANVYYRILHLIADVAIPRNVGDFRLIDRAVLNGVQSIRETTCYWRGMIAWTGFAHTFVDFKREQRAGGIPGYTWKKSFKLGIDGITGFSSFPLEIAAYVGFFVIITGSLMLAYITYDAVINAIYYPLFKWLTTIVYIFMGVQFLLMWLIGEYIGRIYMQQKQRPLYLIKEEKGLEKKIHEDNAYSPKNSARDICCSSADRPNTSSSTFE